MCDCQTAVHIQRGTGLGDNKVKADLNLFKYHLVPKMKLTPPIVQNISELVS